MFRFGRLAAPTCNCCGAPWNGSGCVAKASRDREVTPSLISERLPDDLSGVHAVIGFPCRCRESQFCSTCLYCVEHCECGDGDEDRPLQDLQPDEHMAVQMRIARKAAGEVLPEIFPRKDKYEAVARISL